jgi:hypothetical protein
MLQFWKTILPRIDGDSLHTLLQSEDFIFNWLQLASTPNGAPFDTSFLLKNTSQLQTPHQTVETRCHIEANTSIRLRALEALSELFFVLISQTVSFSLIFFS